LGFAKHIIIPDTQCKPDVPLDHLTWIGRYIAEKQCDVLIHLGDHWDMPSLSSYDRGKKAMEGRRYKRDIAAGNLGMDLLNKPMAKMRKPPRKIFITGNHEDRITRAVEMDAALDGVIGWQDFNLDAWGWEVQPYLRPIEVHGVLYAHYFYNPRTGRPWSGGAATILRHVGQSFVQGHRQGLDSAVQDLPTGKRRRGIIAGSCYQHDEFYLGAQGQSHWRGLLVLHEVKAGNFDLLEVSLDYLKRRYS
jgi:hypothetical protein